MNKNDDDGGNGKTKTVQRDKAKMLKPLNIINKDPEPESKMITTDKGVFVETNYIKNEGLADMVNYRGGARSDSDVKIQNDIDQLLSQPVLIQKGGKVKNFGESKTTTASSNDEEVRQKLDKILLSDFTNSIKNGQDASLTKVPSKNQIEGNDDKKTPSSNNIDEIKEEKKEAEPEIKLEDLKKLGDLGAGSQGHVSKMMDKTTGNIIALKVIKLNSDQSFLKSLKIELQTLQSCRSEFIVHCQGVFLDQDTISIALEYMDKGSLAGLLKKMGKLSETILGMITFQVLKGLEYLHKTMKVIHRDIKPSNLLINSKGQVKIADFGVSGKIDSTFEYKQTWVGTLPYMSPERCKGEPYNFDTDIWGLGLTIAECALGRYPYIDKDSNQSNIAFWDILEYISTKPVPDLPKDFSEDIKDFVSICLRKESGTRSTATELLKHKFVKKYASIGTEENSRDKRSNSVKRERAKLLAPLNIVKDNVEAKMVQNGNVTVVEPDYLSKSGIFLNNSKGSSHSDFESKIEKDISDLKNKSGYNNNNSSSQNGYNNLSMNRANSYENEKLQNYKYGNQNQFMQDQDGFAIPQSKNIKSNNIQPNYQQGSPNFQMMYNSQPNFQQQSFQNNSYTQPEQFYQNQNQYQYQYNQNQYNTNTNQNQNQFQEELQEEDKDDELRLEDLESQGLIGAGSQGHVEKCIHKPSGNLVALKVVKLNSDENFLKALKVELNTLQNCHSDHIVKCYGAFLVQDTISIALEYMDKGSLADILKVMGPISETVLGMITFQVLKGLEYLHKTMKVIHRDIKPSNLLVNSSGEVKIADFGVSGKVDSTFECRDTWVGTLPYMSPERCRGESYNFESDIWSLGLTIVECALGRYPYVDQNSDESKLTFWDLLERISSQPVPTLPDGYSQDIRDFVSICLRKEVGTRTTASELLKHKFVAKYWLIKSNKNFVGWLENL